MGHSLFLYYTNKSFTFITRVYRNSRAETITVVVHIKATVIVIQVVVAHTAASVYVTPVIVPVSRTIIVIIANY